MFVVAEIPEETGIYTKADTPSFLKVGGLLPEGHECICVILVEQNMARNLRQVNDLTLTCVRESTVVVLDFADVDMHAPPAFIVFMGVFMGSREGEIRRFSSRDPEVIFF